MALDPDLQEFTTTSPVLVNFDWTDLSGGTGYIRFLGGQETKTGDSTYFLTRQTMDAFSNKTGLVGSSTNNINFDININTNLTIRGTAIINFSQQAQTVSAGGHSLITIITIYHVDADNNETSLGTATTIDRTSDDIYRECMTIEITEKVFVKGDKLRISADVTHVGGNVGFIWHDPASGLSLTDSLGRTVGSDFSFEVPFKISR